MNTEAAIILYSAFTKLSEFHQSVEVQLSAFSHEPVRVHVRAHLCFKNALQALDAANPTEGEIVLNTIPYEYSMRRLSTILERPRISTNRHKHQ
jgi:hypothetical protein